MLTMLDLWTNYEHLMLCTLNGLPLVAAMELERFREMQHTHCEKVVQTLKKKWYPSVLDIFRRDGRDDGDDLSPSLLAAVSTLMFNQLRELLKSSVGALVAFFEKFADEGLLASGETEPSDEKLHSEDVAHRPLFVVKMLTEAEGYKFSPSLPTLLKSVLGIVDHFVAMLNTVPRIEAELGKAPGGPRLLTIATADDEVIVNAKAKLEAILKSNYEATEGMHARLRAAPVPAGGGDGQEGRRLQRRGPLALGVHRRDRQVRQGEEGGRQEVEARGALHAAHRLVRRGPRGAARADELCERLRELQVKGEFIAKCAELCSRYMEIFMRLGVHPTTEEEMVELEAFLGESAGLLRRSTASSTRRASRCASSSSRRSASSRSSCRRSATRGAGRARSSPRWPRATSGSRRSATARRRS